MLLGPRSTRQEHRYSVQEETTVFDHAKEQFYSSAKA